MDSSDEEEEVSYPEQKKFEESDHEEDDESEVKNKFQEKGSTFHYRKTMYAVVTLKPSAEVVVVAKTWLTEDKKQSHWPPFKSPESITEAVIARCLSATQGKLWEKVDVTVHGEFDTYDDAKQFQLFLRSQEASKNTPPSQQPGPSPLKRRKLDTEKKLQPGPSKSAVTSHIRPAAPSIQSGSKPNETENCMEMLRETNNKVQQISVMLEILLSKIFNCKLPLTSLEDVDRLEEELKDDTTMQYYVQQLRKLGGSVGKIVGTMMQAVMTDNLSEGFSLKRGTQNKRAIFDLTLTKVIKEAALYHKIDHTTSEKEIGNWLRSAAYRNKQKLIHDLKDREAGKQPVILL
ncbi:hypothetical protein AMEX_G4918 [Astyanax mexicanus]|nr:hypothetical protein AMEX_G4918 [Astyanax mexicanus]